MKKTLFSTTAILAALSISSSARAASGDLIVTKCRLYNPPNASIEIPSVGNQRFELNGLSVEVKETSGCTTDCYSTKEISVTENGITFSTFSETKKREFLFPTLSITKNGNKRTVQCMLAKAQ